MWEDELKNKWGIQPRHKESCEKALAKFKKDMRASYGDDGYGTNPFVEKALTFYAYYEDIFSNIESLLKQQREMIKLPTEEEILANGKEGGLRDGELQMFYEGADWLKNRIQQQVRSKIILNKFHKQRMINFINWIMEEGENELRKNK